MSGDRLVSRVVLDALHEGAIDLDHVDREAAQLRERREAGAEVVDRDPHAQVVQFLELLHGAVACRTFRDDRGLGHLEAELARLDPGVGERAANELADTAGGELLRGHVDPDDEGLGQQPVLRPASGLVAGFPQHELTERIDQTGRLGDRDELARWNRAAGRRPPPQQRLDADDLAALERDLRLVVDVELTALQTEAKLVLDPEQVAQLAAHVVVEHRDSGRGRPSWPRTSRGRRAASAPRSCRPRRRERRRRRSRRATSRGPRGRISFDSRSSSRSATVTESGSSASSSRSANSSPPSRASVSLGRIAVVKRRATSSSSWSPASWPSVSLTCLNPSRSTNSTASDSPVRAERDSDWSSRSRKSARLARPGQAVVEGLVRELLLEPDALGDVARVQDDRRGCAGRRAGR